MTGYLPMNWCIFIEILKWTCTKQWGCSYRLRHEGQILDNFKKFLSIKVIKIVLDSKLSVLWNPKMVPDRTILHLVIKKKSQTTSPSQELWVHTIKPQLRPCQIVRAFVCAIFIKILSLLDIRRKYGITTNVLLEFALTYDQLYLTINNMWSRVSCAVDLQWRI